MKIGIDIGGSHMGVGLMDGPKMLAKRERDFNPEERKDMGKAILKVIPILIEELLEANKLKIEMVELIGIAVPGTISGGTVVKAGNLKLENFEMISKLKKIYPNRLQMRNDGKCAALAEKKYGAMKSYDDCVFINIGTGIGGAVFLEGKLLEPKKFSGFELGHMVLNPEGPFCSCGKQGCFETYSSISALKRKVTKALGIKEDISGRFLREELLIKQEASVKEELEVFLKYLKVGIGNLIDMFEPEVICLGGSFAYYEGSPIWQEMIEKLEQKNARFNDTQMPAIVSAKLKNDAGIIGAVIE